MYTINMSSCEMCGGAIGEGSGKKPKYNTKKFAKDFRTVQQLVGTKSQRRKVGDAGTDKAVKMIGSGPKKTSAWISHVKKVMADKGISYKEALSVASQTYKKN